MLVASSAKIPILHVNYINGDLLSLIIKLLKTKPINRRACTNVLAYEIQSYKRSMFFTTTTRKVALLFGHLIFKVLPVDNPICNVTAASFSPSCIAVRKTGLSQVLCFKSLFAITPLMTFSMK